MACKVAGAQFCDIDLEVDDPIEHDHNGVSYRCNSQRYFYPTYDFANCDNTAGEGQCCKSDSDCPEIEGAPGEMVQTTCSKTLLKQGWWHWLSGADCEPRDDVGQCLPSLAATFTNPTTLQNSVGLYIQNTAIQSSASIAPPKATGYVVMFLLLAIAVAVAGGYLLLDSPWERPDGRDLMMILLGLSVTTLGGVVGSLASSASSHL